VEAPPQASTGRRGPRTLTTPWPSKRLTMQRLLRDPPRTLALPAPLVPSRPGQRPSAALRPMRPLARQTP
jgi:hypothetical protein